MTTRRVKRSTWLRETRASTPADWLALWVHLYDPHDPYEPPEPYATRYAGSPYDGEVAWSDTLVGQVRVALEQAGLLASTLSSSHRITAKGLGSTANRVTASSSTKARYACHS